MKQISFIAAVAGALLSATLCAAEGTRALSSLPATVYLITEPIANGAPGQTAIYEVHRADRRSGAAFSDKTGAEAFLSALPDAKERGRTVAGVPRGFVADTLKMGDSNLASWLVAATEDRFLQSIGRAQRFGTQLTTPIVVDGVVTDRLRGELNVPSLPPDAQQSRQ